MNQTGVDFSLDDVEVGVDGGASGVYDGIIYWVMKDGTAVNRFRGEGSRREARIYSIIEEAGYPLRVPA